MKARYFAVLLTVLNLHASPVADALVVQPPQELTGTSGRFDFIKVDAARHRLLASHTGNGSLDVIDLATGKLIKSVPTGNAQGVACDTAGHRYFVSVSKPPSLVIVDSAKLIVLGHVTLPDPADLVAYQPKLNRVYVCDDEKPEMWVIDPAQLKIVATLTLPGGGMEDLGFDDQGSFLYQCLKDSSELARIDLAAVSVVAHWTTLPAQNPHGSAVVPGAGRILVVGGNGKLVLMSLATGQVLSSVDVSPRIDEFAYDPQAKRVYCASGLGTISVVKLNDQALVALPPLPSQKGAHSIAVDPATGTVWIAFADANQHAFVQSFKRK